jgi:hypothetical protein
VIPWRQLLLSYVLALGGVLLAATTSRAGILDASWTAPTTNVDGSPLADLASYRVYYGTFDSICSGSTFFEVPSATPSPGPGETVNVRFTGLSTGTLYYVSVTAVNASGGESACTIPEQSAVARFEFSVSPPGVVNFGTVNVGSFADRTFTVQNTAGGTVSGAASVSAPFSIVSGSSFTLVGAGATRTVTVRFTPLLPLTIAANVTFTANGGTTSRIVTGGTPGVVAPTVAITSPTTGPSYSTTNPSLTLGGIASSAVGVSQVTWMNSRGGSGVAAGRTNWTVPGIGLQLGTNVITVTARDTVGSTAEASLTVTLTGTSFTFTDDPLRARNTIIRAAHIMELRAAIDLTRLAAGLTAFAWTDPTLIAGTTPVRAVHLTELRTALDQAYQAAARIPPTYSDPDVVAGIVVIRASHLNELRAAVLAF